MEYNYLVMAGDLAVSYFSEEINLYTFENYLTAESLIVFNSKKAEEVCKEINSSTDKYKHTVQMIPIDIKLMP